jgi:hypothetical protein
VKGYRVRSRKRMPIDTAQPVFADSRRSVARRGALLAQNRDSGRAAPPVASSLETRLNFTT